jgi:type IV pilus assembly protein PilY1
MKPLKFNRQSLRILGISSLCAGVAILSTSTAPNAAAGTNPTLLISQVPLTIAAPSHPQVLIAIGNSQSMDGDLSGAIMTGSGSLSSALGSLTNSSSPINYTVPTGFSPPLQAANAAGQAPYTVNTSGTLYDNGASRLNVAKGGIQAILSAYMQNTDFALEDYSTNGTSLYATWVYYMSPQSGNFTFTNTPTSGSRYVNNPCYGYTKASTSVKSYCTTMANSNLYTSSSLANNQYMNIGASSDDPSINDVLYAGGQSGLFVTYGGPNPSTPYPPNFTLANYNNGSIFVSYNQSSPNNGAFGTSPTNAGYVPFSPQVMYADRGFGYYVQSVTANSGNVVVPMTSAGTNPTASSVNTAIGAFTPFLKAETNSASTNEIKALAYQSPLAGLLKKANSYLTGLPATNSGCPQKQYVVLISDGLPTMDLSGKAWPPLGSAAAQGYGVTATFNSDGSLNTTNDQALTDAISSLAALKQSGIKTYIVGLGAGVDPSLNAQAAATLQAMAIAGGTANYYKATSPTDLVNDLNSILIAVQNGSLATSSAAVNSTQLNTSTTGYQASFTSNDSPYQDWTGNLVATGLVPTTGGAFTETQKWSAQALLDAQVAGTGWQSPNRLIATWNPTLSNGAGSGTPFEWTNLSTAQQTLLQPSDTIGQNRLQYLRGNTALEQHNGGAFRNRSHVLGDIVDSQPLYVGAPSDPYFQPSYFSFQSAEASRTPMVYVGADDGMLHAFNANTGAEQFAYVPNAEFGNLASLTVPLYNQSHLFSVDGSPNSGDVQFSDGSWHTLLVGGENGGGNSIYALDVTNPQSITTESQLASKVLWEFTDADMGLSYSQPQIAPISVAVPTSSTATQSYAVFFGNGYNSPNNNAVLYAVNPQTGAIIRKINLCAAVAGACNSGLAEGLSTVAVANADGLLGQPITQVYAGDLQGNLWAVDVSNPNPALWTARLLFKARDASGNAQPITTQPVVTLNPNYPRKPGLFVMFGTGQLLTQPDLSSQQIQSVYGVWDKPGAVTTFTRTNLQQQTLNLVSAATSGLPQDILTDTSNAVNWGTQVGWFEDFPTAGERVVVNPGLLNGSFQATLNTPPSNLCSAGYSAMFLDISYLSGGAFQQPQLDTNGSGSITPSNNYNGANPVGIALRPGYASQGVVLTGGGGSSSIGSSSAPTGFAYVMFTDPNTGKHYWKLVPLNQVPRSAWWQIQ